MRNRYVQAPYLSPGFSDFGDYHDAFSCVGGRAGDRMIGRGVCGEADIEYKL